MANVVPYRATAAYDEEAVEASGCHSSANAPANVSADASATHSSNATARRQCIGNGRRRHHQPPIGHTEEAYIGVLENDTGSNLVVRSITSQGAFGQCVISINLAEVVYTPSSPTFIGSDECRYEACDDEEDCSEATVRITIKEDTTSDPTLFPGPRPEPTPNPPPTKEPSIFLGTIATQAPTLNRDRPTNKPTNRPVTPFPTEEEEEVIVTDKPTFFPTKKAEDSYKTTDSYDGYYVERYPAASSESSESSEKSADEYKPKKSYDNEKSYDSGWVTSHDDSHTHLSSKSSKSSSSKSSKASGASWSGSSGSGSGSGDSWTGSSGRRPYSSSSGSSWSDSGSGSGSGKSRKLRKNLRH